MGSDPPAPLPVGHARWAWLSQGTRYFVEHSLLDTWNDVFREVPQLYLAQWLLGPRLLTGGEPGPALTPHPHSKARAGPPPLETCCVLGLQSGQQHTHPIYSPPAPSKSSTSGRCCLWWPQGHILIHLNSAAWTVPTPHPPRPPHPPPWAKTQETPDLSQGRNSGVWLQEAGGGEGGSGGRVCGSW